MGNFLRAHLLARGMLIPALIILEAWQLYRNVSVAVYFMCASKLPVKLRDVWVFKAASTAGGQANIFGV